MFWNPSNGETPYIQYVVHMYVYVNIYKEKEKNCTRQFYHLGVAASMLGNAVGFPPQDGTNSVRSTETNMYLLIRTK